MIRRSGFIRRGSDSPVVCSFLEGGDESDEGAPVAVAPVDPGPIATWAGVATACGVSVDTIARHRPPGASPLPFPDASAARAWFRRVKAGRGVGGRPPKTLGGKG
jgi:hypothetical protein